MAAIVCNKNILGGKPRIEGTRISIDVIGDYLSFGYGVNEIRRDYPHLTKDQIDSALSYIADKALKEKEILESKTS